MQLTARSYLMAGMAAAGAGALAIAPLPSQAPDVTVPAVDVPVALSAQPSPLEVLTGAVITGIANGQTLGAGLLGSGASANTFYPADLQTVVGLGAATAANLPNTLQGLLENPEAILTAPVGFAVIGEQLNELVELQTFGTTATGSQTPGVPFPAIPVSKTLVPTVAAPTAGALLTVAQSLDNQTTAALGKSAPRLATPVTASSLAVGTSVIQAQGLVRSASLTAVVGVAAASTTGNPNTISGAIQAGATGVQNAILGDSTATKGTVKNLGAIGTVSATVKKAADNIGNAVTGGV